MAIEEGHTGLSNEKKEEVKSGNFQSTLSFLKKDRHTGYWIIHVYSKTFELDSPYVQRSNADGRRWKKNFMERIGFTHFSSCNVLDGECYYKVLEEVHLGEHGVPTFERLQANTEVLSRFRNVASQFEDIYKKMRELTKFLLMRVLTFQERNWNSLPLGVAMKMSKKSIQKAIHMIFIEICWK